MDEFEVVETTPSDISAEVSKHSGGFSRLASLIVGGVAVVGGSIAGSALVPSALNQSTGVAGVQDDPAFADSPSFSDPTPDQSGAGVRSQSAVLPSMKVGKFSGVSFSKSVKPAASSSNNLLVLPDASNLDFGATTNATSAWTGGGSSGSGNTTNTTQATGGSGSGSGGGNTTNTTQSSGGSGSGGGYGDHEDGDNDGHGDRDGDDD
ncbi:MAG: hypothetical protein RL670_1254 [Actinomycetota bacterium]